MTRKHVFTKRGPGHFSSKQGIDLQGAGHSEPVVGWGGQPLSQHAFYESRTAGGPDLVDTKDLKVLARKMLPEDSPLRRLILSEKDTMPYSEWLGKMEIFGRLLDQETIVISPGGQ